MKQVTMLIMMLMTPKTPMAGCFEHGNEPMDSMKGQIFLD
jgi:hypothetical protein